MGSSFMPSSGDTNVKKLMLPVLVAAVLFATTTPLLADSQKDKEAHGGVLNIAVFGDSPYGVNNADTAQFIATPAFIQSINADPDVSLVLNVGDLHSGKQVCTQAYDQSIYNMWTAFRFPVVYTPGDNEWADCHKSGEGSTDPLINLGLVRKIFFASPGHTIAVDKLVWPQSANFDPNYHLGCGVPVAPFGPFTTIANIGDKGDARYDSLQFKAETKSARHGLYVLVGYTYARNFDSGFPDGLGTTAGATYYPLPNTRKADWALSQIQLNHNFTASMIYDLPFGKGKTFGSNWSGPVNAVLGNWEVDVIEKITSGFPVFIDDSINA